MRAGVGREYSISVKKGRRLALFVRGCVKGGGISIDRLQFFSGGRKAIREGAFGPNCELKFD